MQSRDNARPYIVFTFRHSYGFMFVMEYICSVTCTGGLVLQTTSAYRPNSGHFKRAAF